MDIRDFDVNKTEVSVEDLHTTQPSSSAFNTASISNMAAKVATLSEGDPVETYSQISLEMDEGRTDTAQELVQIAEDKAREDNQRVVTEMLSDPSIDEHNRLALGQKWAHNANEKINLNTLISKKAILEDSSPFEDAEEESVRIDMASRFDQIDEYRKDVQKYINSSELENDPSKLSKVADFLEVMVPFTESALITKVIEDLRSDDEGVAGGAFVTLGNAKAEIRDMFAKLPIGKRRELIPHVLAIVKGSDTIVFDDTNDIVRNDFLRTIVDEGYYGDGSQIIDNVVSVLDLVGLGGIFKSGVRTLKSVGKTAKKADDIIDDGVDVAEEIDPSQFKPDEAFNPHKPNLKTETGTDVAIRPTGLKKTRQPNWKYEPIIREKLEGTKQLENVRKQVVRSNVQPTSLSQVYKDVNPQKARNLHAAVQLDETGKVAKATYGTSRAEAVANDILPEVDTSSGSMRAKLSEPDALVASFDLIKGKANKVEDVKRYTYAEKGAIQYTQAEKAHTRSNVVNDFQNVTGLTSRKEMFTWGAKSDGALIKGVYGPTDGGFTNASDAAELAKIQLRKYGLDDSNITILSRDGENYIPLDADTKLDQLPKGDYLVQVDYRYRFNDNDIVFKGGVDVNWNLFDYVPILRSGNLGVGSVQSNLLDVHSMINPLLTKSASAAIDKGARLKKLLGDSTIELEKGFNKLSKDRQQYLINIWKDANAKGYEIDNVVASAKNLTVKEKELSDTWRETWDAIYHLDNEDLKTTLKSQGYGVFSDSKNGTTLYGKTKAYNGKGGTFYNPKTNKIETIDKDSLKEIYDRGGEVISLKTPLDVNGDTVTKLISFNDKSGYLRALNDSDKVLNYRKGYYQVQYVDPYFIEREVRLPNGEIKTQAVATARTKGEADLLAKRITEKSGVQFKSRLDKRQTTLSGDDAWQTIVASGRSSQSLRGKRLASSIGSDSFDTAHLTSPAEALEASIHSVTRRVEMRDWLESAKSRVMSEFKDVLPKDDKGRAIYPQNNKDIKVDNVKTGNPKSAQQLRHEAADASTVWEYIRSMEDGYINHVDEITKGVFNTIAETLGGRGNVVTDAIEEFSLNRARGLGVTNYGKKKAFQLYLALNPLRQIVVQSHQMLQIAGLQPTYFFGKMSNEASILSSMINYFENGAVSTKLMDKKFSHALERLNMTSAEAVDLYNDWQKSGLGNAVDVHNLVRSDWEYATRGDFITSGGRLVDKAIEPIQRVGFDAGERANIMSAFLAFRHRAFEQGRHLKTTTKGRRTLSNELADEVVAEARNFTYNMNRAGDLPYNSTALNLAMQFLQVPHKATTQVLFNRVLTRAERLRMFTWNSAVYGIPTLYIVQNLMGDVLPDDPVLREAMTHGLESVILNEVMSQVGGEEVDIDWSTLAPHDMHGTLDTVQLLFTSPLEALGNAPALQLVGEGGRIRELLKSSGRMFGLAEDFEDDPTTFWRVANDFAKLSSGYSNAFKSFKALKDGEKLNTYGDQAFAVNKTEAILQAFGFNTMEEATQFKTRMKLYQSKKDFEEDFTKWFKDYKRHMSAEGKPLKYYDNISRTFNEAFRVWPKNKRTMDLLKRELRRTLQDGDLVFHKRLLESIDWMDSGKLKDIVREERSLNEEKKGQMLQIIEDISNSRKAIE